MALSNLSGITRADLEAEIGNNWCLIYSGEDVSQVEIRCIDPVAGVAIPKMFYKDDYDDLECFHRAIESYAIDMNLSGSNAYICMNPIRTDFAGTRANDKAIQYRDLLLIDIDRAGTHKVPSTEAELQASLDMGDSVAEWLSSKGFPAPIKTCSGNGCHLYYPLQDLENTDSDRDLVKTLLTILGEQFNTPDIEIDPSVSNASRITKFLGTIMRKGTETPDRPYRMARMVVMNGQVHKKVTRALIQNIVDEYQATPSNSYTPNTAPRAEDQYGEIFSKSLYPESVEIDLLKKALDKISPDDKRGDGTFKDGSTWLATVLAGASLGEAAREPLRQWSMQSDKYKQKDFDDTFDSYDPSKVGRNGGPLTVASLHGYVNSLNTTPNVCLGDIGNAIRLAELYRGRMIFVRDSSLVLVYDSVIGWIRGNAEDPYRAAQALVKAMAEDAAKNFANNPSDSNALKQLTEVRRASKKPAIDAMIALAKAEDGMSVDMAECDADSYLIGVLNGVVDLKSGQLLPPDPSRLVTKRANVYFDPEAECPLYEKFLREAVPDDDERAFLIRFSGYCLSGEVSEQVLLFLLGTGANGKTVWIETMKAILGDYADKIQTEMLMQHFRNTQAASPDLVQLQGRRFIYANETTEGRFLDDARVKDLTGGDTITGRLPYAKAAISFAPTHKLVIAGNHAPIVTDDSDGLWRRMILMKFTQKFEGDACDRDLPAKLRAEAAGIFNLWLKGFAAWHKHGLMIPPSLRNATNVYRSEQDLLEQFIGEECVVGVTESCANNDLKRRYFSWCEDNNTKPLSGHRFSRKLTERGYFMDDDKRTRRGISVGLRAGMFPVT